MPEPPSPDRFHGYTRRDGVALIEIRISAPEQLFNSLDPSPFREKDLDEDAEEYIIGAADEFSLAAPLRLVIHIPDDRLAGAERTQLPEAIHHYFAYRLDVARRQLRILFRFGRVSLAIALLFLFACLALRQVIPVIWSGAVAAMAREGLLIAGWVAMWRPLEIFLYEWWPIRHRCLINAKLAQIPIEIKGAG